MSAVYQFPTISDARLPAAYEVAKTLLAQCSRIDECKTWANKAEALASYARQAKDETLTKYALRIQARAIKRCGELLKQIQPAKNQHDASARDGAGPSTRAQAAKEAGMSDRQRKTALRVACVPEAEFDAAVESNDPPTVSSLAERGTHKQAPLVDLGGIPPEDYARATKAQGTLKRFAEFCQKNEPIRIAQAFMPHEVHALRQYVATVDAWLDQFITHLPE